MTSRRNRHYILPQNYFIYNNDNNAKYIINTETTWAFPEYETLNKSMIIVTLATYGAATGG